MITVLDKGLEQNIYHIVLVRGLTNCLPGYFLDDAYHKTLNNPDTVFTNSSVTFLEHADFY